MIRRHTDRALVERRQDVDGVEAALTISDLADPGKRQVLSQKCYIPQNTTLERKNSFCSQLQ